MTPIEQAIEALEYSKSNASGCTCHTAYTTRQMTDPSCAACEYHEVMQGVDRALAALRSMEGKEPVALSDEGIERASYYLYPVCDVYGVGGSHDINFQPRIHAAKALRYVRDHGYVAPPNSEPRLTVEEAIEIVSPAFASREDAEKARDLLTKAAQP